MNKTLSKLSLTMAAAMLVAAPTAQAGPYGYDLHNTLAPASQGLAGTSIARPQDTVSSVFGNPATLTQFTGTQFTFGATFYKPEVKLEHDGSVTGTAFKEHSDTDIFPVPQIAITQDLRGLNLPATLGLGLTATSGIGTSFRNNSNSLGAGAEFIVFGVNAGLGYELTNNLSLGAAATVSFAQMDLGLASSSAQTHDIGVRGTVGLNYDFGDTTTIGGFYQTKLKHDFDDLIAVEPGNFKSVTIEQPANVGIGIANNSLMNGDLLLMADFMYKFWSDADFWGDLYNNQKVASIGAQLTRGSWKYRIGYAYNDDPTNDGATAPIGSLTQFSNNVGVIPLIPPVIAYLQAAETEVIYQHRIGLGLGYSGFLMPNLDLDMGGGWQFKNDHCYGKKGAGGDLSCGGHSKADVYSWNVGMGLTWKF